MCVSERERELKGDNVTTCCDWTPSGNLRLTFLLSAATWGTGHDPHIPGLKSVGLMIPVRLSICSVFNSAPHITPYETCRGFAVTGWLISEEGWVPLPSTPRGQVKQER